MSALDLVRGTHLFSGLAEADIVAVAGFARERRVAAGGTLFNEKDESDAFFLVGRGRVEVGLEDGHQWVHYYWVGAGEAVGIVSFFGRSPHRTTARASEETLVLEIGKEALPRLRQMPALVLSIFHERTERMRRLVEKEDDISALSRDELTERAESLCRLLEELEDQSTALHNEIHRAQIRLHLYEAHLANRRD